MYVAQIVRSLAQGAEVLVLELPDLPDKGDVSDWLADGGTAEQLTELARSAASGVEWLSRHSSGGEASPGEPTLTGKTRERWPAPLGDAAYHGLAGKFVRLVEPTTEADP